MYMNCDGYQGFSVLHSLTSYLHPKATTQKTNHRGSPVMACKRVVDKRTTWQCDLFVTVLPETL